MTRVRIDIGRVTLNGYHPRQRDHFARAIAAQITGRGAPREAARQAAEKILAAADAELRRERRHA